MENRFETFTTLVNNITRYIKKLENSEMQEYGLRSYHISILYQLHLKDGLTASDLVDSCQQDKASISRGIDYLEENDFVKCESKSTKRYKSPICLTTKGKEAASKIDKKINYFLDEVTKNISQEERETLYRCLFKISDGLKKIVEEGE